MTLRGRNGNMAATLMNYIADLAIMTGTRTSNKGFIPKAACRKMILEQATVDIEGHEVPGPISRQLDFSGVCLFRFIKKFQEMEWTLMGAQNMTNDITKQIV